MSKWKPKNKETYYTLGLGDSTHAIFEAMWGSRMDKSWDEGNFKSGDCYKTRKEALVVLNKILRVIKKGATKRELKMRIVDNTFSSKVRTLHDN